MSFLKSKATAVKALLPSLQQSWLVRQGTHSHSCDMSDALGYARLSFSKLQAPSITQVEVVPDCTTT
jgi:hypothetical protein